VNYNVIPVPYWIVDTLHKHGMRSADILDYDKARSVLSIEDMATVVAMSQIVRDSNVVAPLSVDGIQNEWSVVKGARLVSNNSDGNNWSPPAVLRPEYQDYISRIGWSEQCTQEVSARLTESYRREGEPTYTLLECEREYSLLVCRPGFIEGLGRAKFQFGLIERIVELFYVYFGGQASFELPLYGRYIRLINQMSRAQA
jgi:hypothetical protein